MRRLTTLFISLLAAGGMIFNVGPDEFIVVGKEFMLTFNPVKQDKN